ncbi:low temperature requirement protein A [Catenulispora sp. NL8]|uniref:Low temperature requirement protein A n=1 Tax=Catenulispora pinistramenti TaxID=2705254 RepID=A0ABS5L4H2_9ACTN|nr:low temperature requirement protein A [Catenulispora pinistramenti]MBS2553231.1 low temperature requirement protein A [Catenulispora pinistramenti]
MASEDYPDTPIEAEADGDSTEITADDSGEDHGRSPHAVQRVTWAELFFDLVFVFAVTQIAHAVYVGAGWAGLGRSVLLFVPFWWAWVGCAILFNGMVITATKRHLLLLAIAGAAFVMCISVPDAYGNRGVLFGGAYLVSRILLGIPMQRREAFRIRLNPFTVGVLAGLAWTLAGLLPADSRQWAWLAIALIELAVPIVLGHRLDYMQFDASHLPERFGLFIIIALGETLTDIGQGGTHIALHSQEAVTLFVAFLLSCGLWWTYFQYGASATEHALRVAKVPAVLVRSSFTYGHMLFVLGIILAAAGMSQAVADPGAHLHGMHALLLGSGVTLYIATFCYTRIMMFGGASYTRVGAALGAAVITALSPGLPALAPLAMLAALVIALNAVEFYRVSTGKPLLLINVWQGAAGR